MQKQKKTKQKSYMLWFCIKPTKLHLGPGPKKIQNRIFPQETI